MEFSRLEYTTRFSYHLSTTIWFSLFPFPPLAFPFLPLAPSVVMLSHGNTTGQIVSLCQAFCRRWNDPNRSYATSRSWEANGNFMWQLCSLFHPTDTNKHLSLFIHDLMQIFNMEPPSCHRAELAQAPSPTSSFAFPPPSNRLNFQEQKTTPLTYPPFSTERLSSDDNIQNPSSLSIIRNGLHISSHECSITYQIFYTTKQFLPDSC